MPRFLAAMLVVLLLAACAPDQQPPAEAQPSPAQDLPLPDGAAEGTPWRDTGLPVEFDAEATHASPDDLVQTVASALALETVVDGADPEVRADVLDVGEEQGSARVVIGGFADDSVYGTDYFLALTRDAGGWHVDQTWTRDLCRRGLSNGLCL